jgi:glycosyltransferase involved in cell wall biosynthesis
MTRYRLIGFLAGGFGLAIAARNTRRALASTGREVVEIGVDERSGRRLPGAGGLPSPAPDDVNIFHMNPVEVAKTRGAWAGAVSRRAACACVPFWELPLVPRKWEPMLEGMDAVLAPTRFVQEACSRAVPASRVLHYPQAVFIPGAAPARDAWGFARGVTVFLIAFDVGSDIARKNPVATIDAFQRAFPTERDVALVVKTKPYPDVPRYQDQAQALRERVAGDPRIRVVDRELAYEELLRLYASCDAMVSLHRSEGLGLHLMEAMSLGRPVVATGWSGNTDFMTQENSLLVGHRLVPVQTEHPDYLPEVGREGQVWAEPDPGDAVEALRLLHRDQERRLALGDRAARDMEALRRAMLGGGAYDALDARLAEAEGGSVRPFWSGVRRTAGELRRETLRRRVRRIAGLLAWRPGR